MGAANLRALITNKFPGSALCGSCTIYLKTAGHDLDGKYRVIYQTSRTQVFAGLLREMLALTLVH